MNSRFQPYSSYIWIYGVYGTSINIDRLACTRKVEMKRKDSINEEGGNEKGGLKKIEKITVASRTNFVIKLERNT